MSDGDTYADQKMAVKPGTKIVFLLKSEYERSAEAKWLPMNTENKFAKEFFKILKYQDCGICGGQFQYLSSAESKEWKKLEKKNLLMVRLISHSKFSRSLTFSLLTLGIIPYSVARYYEVFLDYYSEDGTNLTFHQSSPPIAITFFGWLFVLWGPALSSERAENPYLLMLTIDSLLD